MGKLPRHRWRVLLGACCLGAVWSCSGEMETETDAPLPVVDMWQPPTDILQPDGSGPAEVGPAGDKGPPGDGVPVTPDIASLGACDDWSNWTCAADPVLLCKASCQSGGKTYSLSCTSAGTCVCGVSMVPCGPYSYTQPCDACKQAATGGCCLP
jgi:hypothetical protein